MESGLITFLTRENIALHKAHLKTLRLKYSILEKSIPALKGAELQDIMYLKIKKSEREEALRLKSDIISHEIYFSSFTDKFIPSALVAKHYGSESNFIYEVYKAARGKKTGFIYIYLAAAKKPQISYFSESTPFLSKNRPRLAIDLFEHAGFLDYSFDHDRYIENAAAHLNLSRLEEN